jgi:hypothetical protein
LLAKRLNSRKVGFSKVIDFTWKLFSQTGSIETYLLMKELEANHHNNTNDSNSDNDMIELDTNL